MENINITEIDKEKAIIDGGVKIMVDKKYKEAIITVYKPENGGKSITKSEVLKSLSDRGIRYQIDSELIDSIFEDNLYDQPFVVSKYKPAIDGTNGYIKYFFNRTNEIKPKEEEDGSVDFFDLGLITNITAGTIVGEIFPPVEGEDGVDVQGAKILAFPPKPATIPNGAGIVVSEDGTKLVASVDGNIYWKGTCFVIDQSITIKNDVDVSTGNIEFIGDIIIKGDVKENFTVSSKKSITIKGGATGAYLKAKGTITIVQGAFNSTIEAGENVKIGFCENSTITAGGDVIAQSFIACTVKCDGSLNATAGPGAVVGGKYVSLQSPIVNVIGSQTFTKTMIVVGNNAMLTEEREHLLKRNENNEAQLIKLNQIVELLTAQKKAGGLTEEREEMLNSSIKGKLTTGMEIKKNQKRILEIEMELKTSQSFKLTCKKYIYPGTTICINSSTYTASIKSDRCVAVVGDDGLIHLNPL